MAGLEWVDSQLVDVRAILKSVRKNLTKEAVALLEKGDVTGAATRADYLREIDSLFTRSGIQAVTSTLESSLAELTTTGIVELSEDTISSAVEAIEQDLLSLKGELLKEQGDLLVRMVSGEGPSAAAISELAAKMEARVDQAVAVIDTNLAGAQRKATIEDGLDVGADVFRYDGPLDSITRTFCQHTLSGAGHGLKRGHYRLADIQAMDNGQGLDAQLYGGGYNCRHYWTPVVEYGDG